MKYTVSLLLLVAIVHADRSSISKEEDEENTSAKRELLEGNFGSKIQPNTLDDLPSAVSQREHSSENELQKPVPSHTSGPAEAQENGPPKISDVLTGQGPSFPAAITGHLHAPSSVYQARLGSPTTFEVSQPVLSQLRFSRPFSGLASPPVFSEPILSTLEPFLPQPIYSAQRIHSNYPIVDEFPSDLYQQINDLGNPSTNSEETNQYIQNFEDDQGNKEADKNENEQDAEKQDANQELRSTAKTPSASHDKYSTSKNQNPKQAVSYARFSQGFPLSLNEAEIPSQQFLLHPLPSPSPLPQFQQLPQPGRPQLFQPLPELQRPELLQPLPQLHVQAFQQSTPQPPLQSLPLQNLLWPFPPQSTVQPIVSVQPPQIRFTIPTHSTPRPIRVQQETDQLYQRQQSLINRPPQFQFKPQSQFTSFLQNQKNPIAKQQLYAPESQNQQTFSGQQQFSTITKNQLSSMSVQPQDTSFPQNQQNSTTEQQLPFTSQPQNEQSVVSSQQQSALPPTFSSLNEENVSTDYPQLSSQNEENLSTDSENQQTYNTSSQSQETVTTQSDTLFDAEPTEDNSKLNGQSNDESNLSARLFESSQQEESTESSTGPALVSILPKSHSTLNKTPTTSSELIFTSTSVPKTLSQQSVTEAPSSVVAPVPKPQPSSASVETSAPQLRPKNLPALPNVHEITSLETSPEQQLLFVTPQPTLEPYSVTLHPLPQVPGIRAIPVQRYQIPSEPLYSDSPDFLIEQPHYKAASLTYPSTYQPSAFQNYNDLDSFASTQFFGNHAHDIFSYYYKKK